MIRFLLMIAILGRISLPAKALEMEAPPVPRAGEALMPEETDSFSEGLRELLRGALYRIRPDLEEAIGISFCVLIAVLLLSMLQQLGRGGGHTGKIAGCVAVSTLLLGNAGSMIALGSDTVTQISDYGKLLFPVLTAAMAAQGGITASAALYAGTAALDAVLSGLIAGGLIPMVYLFLALSVGNAATGEGFLKRSRDLVKSILSWILKLLLTAYTTYMSITGVISGTTDAAALKATKVTISSFVPVVGGILSDASESVLVSAGVMKNTAGIYGIFAFLALFLGPFLRIGCHYLILKFTAAISQLLAAPETAVLIEDFASAMGLLLAMTGSVCLMQLVSVVCFLKGVL